MTIHTHAETDTTRHDNGRVCRIASGVAAVVGIALCFALWLAGDTSGHLILDDQAAGHLRAGTAVAIVGWLIARTEQRIVLRLERVERGREADSYAAGYVDGCAWRIPGERRMHTVS